MRYYGQFSSNTGTVYDVEIITNNSSADTTTQLIFAGDPVTIETNNSEDSIFTPVRLKSATIRLVVAQPYYDLYSSTATGTSVTIKQGDTIIFFGYLTPNAYNQPYENLVDEIELEAVESPSILQYEDYEKQGDGNVIYMIDILNYLMSLCSINTYYICDSYSDYYWNTDLGISEENFFDDDDEKSPWKCSQVLEEICKYFGCTFEVINGEGHFIDIALVNKGDYNLIKYTTNNNYNGTVENTRRHLETINGVFKNGTNIELDNVYNEIRVTANAYPTEESLINNKIFDNFTTEQFFEGHYGQDFDSNYKYAERYSDAYVKFGKLLTPDYRMMWYNGDYYQTNRLVSKSPDFRYIDYYSKDIGAVPIKLCTPNNNTTTTSWENYILIGLGNYTNNDSLQPFTSITNLDNTRDTFEIINYKAAAPLRPKNTKSYLIIQGQYGIIQYDYVREIFSKNLVELPFYVSNFATPGRSSFNVRHLTSNDHIDLFCYSLRIGNKYYNDNSHIAWQDTPVINKMIMRIDDTMEISCNEFYPFANTVRYQDLIGIEGHKILLPEDVKANEEIELKIYRPLMLYYIGTDSNGDTMLCCFENKDNCCAAFKNFDIKHITVDKDGSILDDLNENDEDTEYFNIINAKNVNTFNGIELKINTQDDRKRSSLSSVVFDARTYLGNITYKVDERSDIMENHIIEKYWNHYHTPKRILNICLDNFKNPYTIYSYRNFNNMFINSQSWSLRDEQNQVKLIEL